MKDTHEVIHVDVHDSHSQSQRDLLSPDMTMVVLTWTTFFLLFAILYKFAWQPILAGLDQRENHIRKSLEDADKVQEEMEKIDQTREEILSDADQEAKEILAKSRKGAVEAAKTIQHKAKEEAEIVLTNADHEIKKGREKAHVELKEESVTVALGLAEKILDEKLDETKHRKLIDKFIKDFDPKDYENK